MAESHQAERHHGIIKGLVIGALVSLLTSATVAVLAPVSLVDATRWGWWVFCMYLTIEWLWNGRGKHIALSFFGSYERKAIVNSYLLVAIISAVLGIAYWAAINLAYNAALARKGSKNADASPALTLPASPTPSVPLSDDQKRAILLEVIQEYKDTHPGWNNVGLPNVTTSPDIEPWINNRIKEKGYHFGVILPRVVVPSRQKGIVLEDSHGNVFNNPNLSGLGTAITLTGSSDNTFNNLKIVGAPPTPSEKAREGPPLALSKKQPRIPSVSAPSIPAPLPNLSWTQEPATVEGKPTLLVRFRVDGLLQIPAS